ncbi:MAG: hypothetical protein OEZ38_04555 [Gammaproteobacteria bacterium]|nr:hypothetical protein [Gammaproteobacteria bacterium]
MDLSRINVKPRIRNAWESIDLGFMMAKSWWWVLFASWFIPAAIVYTILTIIFYDDNWLAVVITWWLKPLFDRAPLFIASRKLFSEDVTIRETLKALPRLYKTDIFPWLLWRRFSLTRSFDMPITVLETLKGKQRTRRMMTLHQNTSGPATWLTIVCVNLEMVIWLGVLGFFMLLLPEEIDINLMDVIIDEGMIAQLISGSIQFFAMALIAPFYTMAGFALYINRRIRLEAWDLEIRFRHLADTQIRKMIASSSVVLLLVSVVFLVIPQNTYAGSNESLTPEQSQVLIKEVLEGDDFHKKITEKGWRLKNISEKEEEELEGIPDWLISLIKFIESIFGDMEFDDKDESSNNLAAILELLLWLLAAVVVIYIIYWVLKFYGVIVPRKKAAIDDLAPPPEILFGLDVRKDSIPDDVAGEVMNLWSKGRHREAVGLLYRSTLSLLIHHFSFKFYDGHTEQECAGIVKQSGNLDLSNYVGLITRNWQKIAYAHQVPVESDIQLLCDKWKEVSVSEK